MRDKVGERRILFKDYLEIAAAEVEFARADGRSSEPRRLVRVDRRDAAAVLLIDRESRELILIEQFRWPTYEKGPGRLLEIVAGVIEDGESPEAAARREAKEEAGLEAGQMTAIATCFPTPGYSTERCFIFAAEVASADGLLAEGGADAGEVTRPHGIGFDEVSSWLEPGRIQDAKTLIALQWFVLQEQRT